MADSYNKKERDKKRRKRKKDKLEKKQQRKLDGKKPAEFMYMGADGNLTSTPPDPSERKEVKLEEINISTPKKSELDPEETVLKGVVKFFNEEKMYGFINHVGTRVDYFVHDDNVVDKIKTGDNVEFELGSGPKGLIAVNVKIIKEE